MKVDKIFASFEMSKLFVSLYDVQTSNFLLLLEVCKLASKLAKFDPPIVTDKLLNKMFDVMLLYVRVFWHVHALYSM